jgi:hypothetical protein
MDTFNCLICKEDHKRYGETRQNIHRGHRIYYRDDQHRLLRRKDICYSCESSKIGYKKVECKLCKIVKYQLAISNKRKDKTRTFYIDPFGNRWGSGKVCPKCSNEYKNQIQQVSNRKKTTIEQLDQSFEEIPTFHTNKTCRTCKGQLETSRYYLCLTCRPHLPQDINDDGGGFSWRSPEHNNSLLNFKISDMKLD